MFQKISYLQRIVFATFTRNLFALTIAFVAGNVSADTYTLGELSEKAPAGYTHNTFSDTSTFVFRDPFPDISTPVIENRGHRLFSGAFSKLVERSDYIDVHYLILETSGLEVVSDNGRKWDIRGKEFATGVTKDSKLLAVGISYQGELLRVTENEFISIDLETKKTTQQITLPVPFVAAHIGTDNEKRWAIIGIDASRKVWMGDGSHWTSSEPNIIGKKSDLRSVLSVFAKDKDEWVGAVYSKLNIYNKGVMLVYGRAGEPAKHAWAINSDSDNYGLFPAVQWKNGVVMVAGIKGSNSEHGSNSRTFLVSIPEQVVRSMAYLVPLHAQSYQEEKDVFEDSNLSAMIGASLASLKWYATSYVHTTASTQADVQYEIASSLFRGVNIEGHIGNRKLALSYLQNQVEDMALQTGGTLGKEASSMLFGYVDFDSWSDPSESMRMTLERAELKGVATYVDSSSSSRQYSVFNNQYSSIALQSIGKTGKYFKSEFAESKLPMAIGFRHGSSGDATAVFFEPEALFQEIRLGGGYDEMAYAYRNEASYTDWYWNGEFSIGVGRMIVGDSILQKAIAAGTTASSNSTLIFGLHANGEAGYLLQRRSKNLNSFGHSFSAGIRLKVDDFSRWDGDWNWSYMAFTRSDVLFGPFVRYNLLF